MTARRRERKGNAARSPSALAPHAGTPRGRPLPARRTVSPWEWAVAALGALLVAAAAGYLFWHALSHPPTPPRLTLAVERAQAGPGGHTVTFRVRNDGTTTAAALAVRGTLSRDGETVEESEAQIDYVPPLSQRTGGLIFRNDPAAFRLELRATGYSAP